MLIELFTALTAALQGAAPIAVLAAFVWGVASVLLSPCHLTSIPVVMGLVSVSKNKSTAEAFVRSLLFSLGILMTITIVGALTALAGRMLGDIGPWGTRLVAVILLFAGLICLDLLKLPRTGISFSRFTYAGPMAAFMAGLMFGLALGPCTFAYMAPVLAVVLTSGIFGAVLVISYAIGHCAVIVLAGTLTERVERYLAWGKKTYAIVLMKWGCGILMMIGGTYLLFFGR